MLVLSVLVYLSYQSRANTWPTLLYSILKDKDGSNWNWIEPSHCRTRNFANNSSPGCIHIEMRVSSQFVLKDCTLSPFHSTFNISVSRTDSAVSLIVKKSWIIKSNLQCEKPCLCLFHFLLWEDFSLVLSVIVESTCNFRNEVVEVTWKLASSRLFKCWELQ